MTRKINKLNIKFKRKTINICSIFLIVFACVLSLKLTGVIDSFAATYKSSLISSTYNDVIFTGIVAEDKEITTGSGITKYKSVPLNADDIGGVNNRYYNGDNTSYNDNVCFKVPKVAYYYDGNGKAQWIDAKVYPKAAKKSVPWEIYVEPSGDGYKMYFLSFGKNTTTTGYLKYEFYEGGETYSTKFTSKRMIMTFSTNRTNHAYEFNNAVDKWYVDSGTCLTRIAAGATYGNGHGYNPKNSITDLVPTGHNYFYQSNGASGTGGNDHVYVGVNPGTADLEVQYICWSSDLFYWYAGIFHANTTPNISSYVSNAANIKINYRICNSKTDTTETVKYNRKLAYSTNSSDILSTAKAYNLMKKTGYKIGTDKWYTSNTFKTVYDHTAEGALNGASTINLYCYYTPITYQVKYNGNGSTSGSMSNSTHIYDTAKALTGNAFERKYTVTYNYNSGTGTPASNVATYEFAGWAKSATGAKAYDNKQSVKNLSTTDGEEVKLYALWTKKGVKLPTPERTGYTFGGWYTDSGLTTIAGAAGATYIPTANMTLYAKWTINKYTLTFDKLTGNSATESSRKVTYNTAFGTLPTATKTGYTFDGWYNETALSTKVATTDKMPAKDKTVYAKYNANKYQVKYNGNGATGGSMSNSNHTYDTAKTLTPNTFERKYTVTYTANGGTLAQSTATASYTFAGWANTSDGAKAYDDGASVKNLSTTNNAVVNLYALWTKKSITLLAPTKEGYTFEGWYSNSGLTTKVGDAGASYIPTSTITLYAKWTINKYTLTFNKNGADSATEASRQVTYNAQVGELPQATKQGYTFNGWFSAATGGTKLTSTYQMPASNKTYYAQFTPYTYTVKYNGNGVVTGSMSDTSFNYGETKALSSNQFARSYQITYEVSGDESCVRTNDNITYSFSGWSKSASGQKEYNDGQSVSNLTNTKNGVVNLYAMWSGTAITLPDATKPGYTFYGWYRDASHTDFAGDANDLYFPQKTETLYPYFDLNKYKLSFKDEGENRLLGDDTLTLGDAFTNIYNDAHTPKLTGYTFDKWYNESTFQTEVLVTDTMPNSNKTIYGKFNANTYQITYDGNNETGGSTSSSNHTYNEEGTLTHNGFERKYQVTFDANGGTPDKASDIATYEFLGWSRTSGDNQKEFNDDANVINLTTINNDIINLYAVWSATSITLPNAEKTGYTFDAWYSDTGLTNYVGDAGDTYTPSAAVTLYAKYTPKTYSISYKDIDGTVLLDSDTKSYSDTLSDIYDNNHIPVDANAIFGGWYLDNEFNTKAEITHVVTGDITLYARWYYLYFDSNEKTYTGSTVSPVITVKDEKGNVLSQGNYTVQDGAIDKVNASSAPRSITVLGSNSNGYYGFISKDFYITKRVINLSDVIITNYNNTDTLITKEYDLNDKTNRAVLKTDLDVACSFDNTIKFSYFAADYEDANPSNTIKKDVTLYNLQLKDIVDSFGNSVLNNYEFEISNKTFDDYGMIVDTVAPKIDKVEIISIPDTYGKGQVIELRITLSEEVNSNAPQAYTIDLEKPIAGTKFATNIPLVFNEISKTEFTAEYIVTEDANGVDGIIGCTINLTGSAYTDTLGNALNLDTTIAKTYIKTIKIITDRFNIPCVKSPDEEETENITLQFEFDYSDVEFGDDYDESIIMSELKIEKILGEDDVTVINDSSNVTITNDDVNNKIKVLIDTTNDITPDNRDGVQYRAVLDEDTVINKYGNGNNASQKSIKVVRNLSDEDIVITYNGVEVSHDGTLVVANENDTFEITIKDTSVAKTDGIISYMQAPVKIITKAVSEFKNFILSKIGWANSLPFDIKFDLGVEPDPDSNIDPDAPIDPDPIDPVDPIDPTPTPSSGRTITVGGPGSNPMGYQVGSKHFRYMDGFSDDTFRPNGSLTRAEMVAILARINANYNVNEDYSKYVTYTDELEKQSSWYKNYLGYATKFNYVEGYPDGEYKASKYVTRAELCKVLVNVFDINSEYKEHIFSDAKDRWYEKYVNNLAYYGYVEGRLDKKFYGNDYVTRAEACKIINGVLQREIRTNKNLSDNLKERFNSTFKDVSSNKWYYYDIIEATMNY